MEKREEPSREGWGRSKAAEGLAGADLQAWAAWWGHMGIMAYLEHGRHPGGHRNMWLSSGGQVADRTHTRGASYLGHTARPAGESQFWESHGIPVDLRRPRWGDM